MKVTALVENTAKDKNLLTMHGLSLYIETKHHKALIDIANEDLFLKNSKKLKIKIEDIDIAVITHGHNDHGGGLKYLLQNNNKAKIYIQKSAFEKQYVKISDKETYIGLDESFIDNPQIFLIDGDYKIDDEISIIAKPKIIQKTPSFNSMLYQKSGGNLILDKFLHEQSVMIYENNITALFAGCAHSGIINIINDAQIKSGKNINYLIGGFHIYNPGLNTTNFDEAKKLSKELLKFNIKKIYTCHCTGVDAFNNMKEVLNDKIDYLHTGKTVTLK